MKRNAPNRDRCYIRIVQTIATRIIPQQDDHTRDVILLLRCGKHRGDGNVYYRHYADLVVGAVDHPVGATAGAEPVVHGREQRQSLGGVQRVNLCIATR